MDARTGIYESEQLLSQYLLLHYGERDSVFSVDVPPGLETTLAFPRRCVECFDASGTGDLSALDLGCAVGGAAFELARYCAHVLGIDYSERFISTAQHLQKTGRMEFSRPDEGAISTAQVAEVPPEIDRSRVSFEVGDAMALRNNLGAVDAVLAANLICRLSEPASLLRRLPALVRSGGQLVITTPATWMETFTPRANWLGGFEKRDTRITTLGGLQAHLQDDFELVRTRDLPFVIREHERKFQFVVAQASVWRRH
ncbi:MAG: putative 4-mercaptohistidine N1-methyltransferase [Verrucomicrobiota bacterium]|nr:putative 4-mercaptohistidine N1-methyltransferase [Verrucomicrobiota bacterium]